MSKKETEDREKLRRRLSRLGRKPSRRQVAPAPPTPSGSGNRLGEAVETPHGPAFILEERYSLDYKHGNRHLEEYFTYDAGLVAQVARDTNLTDVDVGRLLFVDTETTGLVGGAGTVAFLVGVGGFEEDAFVLRQFFLHEPAEEAAMLHALQAHLDAAMGFISFNGRVFDLPLMEMRFRMGLRKRLPITTWPHFDLLFPARRLWRRALPDCTLGTLESSILGVKRTADDVPGEWIPGIYLDYLRTGEVSEIERVIYHNKVDILSLVGLSVEVLGRHDSEATSQLTEAEALGVARWHETDGRSTSASSAFLTALAGDDDGIKVDALRYWTAHMKRSGERAEAVPYWEQWAKLAPDDPRPCIELSMYYEWQVKDYDRAGAWARSALVCLSHWSEGWRRDQLWKELEHRVARIKKKKAAHKANS